MDKTPCYGWENGLVLGVLTWHSANVNEISNLEEVLATADLPEELFSS